MKSTDGFGRRPRQKLKDTPDFHAPRESKYRWISKLFRRNPK
jgi:hypothetical protein